MSSRFTKALISLGAVAAFAVPAAAQARHGSDDPARHVRREHHRLVTHARQGADDPVNHDRGDRRGGNDDGPNHR
jgi:hypothetical protein